MVKLMNATRVPVIREAPVKTVTASGRPGKATNLPNGMQPQPAQKQVMPYISAAPVRSKAEKFAVDFFRTQKRLDLEDEHQEAIIRQSGGVVPPTLSLVRKVYVTNMPSQISIAPSGVSATAANLPPPQDGDRGPRPKAPRKPPGGGGGSGWGGGGGGGGGPMGGGMPGRFFSAKVEPKKDGKATDVVSRNPLSGIISITDTRNMQDVATQTTTASSAPIAIQTDVPSPKFVRPTPFAPVGSSRIDIPTPLTANTELIRSRSQPAYRNKRPSGLSVITQGIGPESGYHINVSAGVPSLTASTPTTAIHIGPPAVRSPKGKGRAQTPTPISAAPSSASPASYGDPTWTWGRRIPIPHAAAESNAVYGPAIAAKTLPRSTVAPTTSMDDLPQVGGPAKGTPQMTATQAGNAQALPLGPPTSIKRKLLSTLRKDVPNKRDRQSAGPLSPSPYLPLGAGTAQKRPAERLRGMEAVRGKKVQRMDPGPLSPSPYLPLGPATSAKRPLVVPDRPKKRGKVTPALPTTAQRPAGTFAGVAIPQRRAAVTATAPTAPLPTTAQRPAGTFAGVVVPPRRGRVAPAAPAPPQAQRPAGTFAGVVIPARKGKGKKK